ncbi:MAG: hypothetical protein WC832_00840 [Anaerolineales bacterium]
MSQKRITFFFLALGILLVVGSVFLKTATPVKAQCGSQASSCKNCHEAQAQKPVNNDGTSWHTQHAFGDFCYLCHAGNNQATEITASHTGMVAPLSDIVTNCKSCHPNDYEAKAQVYATTLGVTVGTGGSSAPAPATSVASSQTEVPCGTVGTPAKVVDYVQRYDEIVLGKKPVNVGNIVLLVLLAILVLGGGFFVLRKEGWLSISFQETKQIKGRYPADVVDMLPDIARLKPANRRALRHILVKPQVASDLIESIEKQSESEEPSNKEE